ncbi:non-ribosomal peptide synthetase, partial [Mesorhizobium mediterraneum]|uniref:non-ribosomal peptide synthetase n=1 Tax=Mesorhizobium mediterraneum TaxID=43617 RepID=UPI00177D4827
PSLRSRLDELARRHGTTLFTTLLAAFQLLLHRYSGQRDIAVGIPVAGRQSVDVEELIGFFVNTLVIRTDCGGDPSFAELLDRVRQTTLEAYSHQDVPFETVVAELGPERRLDRSPLVRVMVAYQNTPQGEVSLAGVQCTPLDLGNGGAKYDLTLGLKPGAGGALEGSLEYSRDLFEEGTVEQMAACWLRLLEAVLQPEQPTSQLDLLGEPGRRLLDEWNRTSVEVAGPHDLLSLWQRRVERTPDRIAMEGDFGALSYLAVDRFANGVARRLRALGVGQEMCVGLCAARSERLIAAMIGVWKVGAAWVSLDPTYPQQRLQAIIEDTPVDVVMRAGMTPVGAAAVLDLDDVEPADDEPGVTVQPDNAAYVIYTSGSTGRAKGVVGTHRAIVNRFHWMWRSYPFDDHDVVAQKTALSFVDAVWEAFGALLAGVRLVVIPDDVVIDPPQLMPLLLRSQVTRMVLVPSLLRLLLDGDAFTRGGLPALRHWTLSGEALPPHLIRGLRERSPGSTILNLYGSSEAAADSTCLDVSAVELGANVSIGRPIFNTRIHILDRYGNPCPVGVAGELCIAGAGLARGYCGDPRLTASRFVPDPFCDDGGARLYRTGDLARRLAHGDIEIVGRSAFQIKIRGMRVEPDEVRSCLEAHPSVREAVVMPVSHCGQTLLAAYLTLAQGAVVQPVALRRHVMDRLPGHMVPASVVVLDRLPLTRSGKVDRTALPAGDVASGRDEDEGYRDAREEIIAGIWGQVLGRERVGRLENFFELGGHSLLATQVMARVRKALGVD